MGDKVQISKVDVDTNKDPPAEFGITSIPILIVKKAGKVMEKPVGLHSKDQLKQVLSQYTD